MYDLVNVYTDLLDLLSTLEKNRLTETAILAVSGIRCTVSSQGPYNYNYTPAYIINICRICAFSRTAVTLMILQAWNAECRN